MVYSMQWGTQQVKTKMAQLSCSYVTFAQPMKFFKKRHLTQSLHITQTIVRGTNMGVDDSLTWLLDEFEAMSVIRSNSLRYSNPAAQSVHDLGPPHSHHENGEQPHRYYSHGDGHTEGSER